MDQPLELESCILLSQYLIEQLQDALHVAKQDSAGGMCLDLREVGQDAGRHVRDILRCLLALRHHTQQLLSSSLEQPQQLPARMQAWQSVARQSAACVSLQLDADAAASAVAVQQQKHSQALAAELAAIAACARGAEASLGGLATQQVQQLQQVVTALHTWGHQVSTLARMGADVRQLAGDTDEGGSGYSEDNFAYGTTCFRSWQQVMQAPEAAAAVQAAMQATAPCTPSTRSEPSAQASGPRPARSYMVWGSSSGWLVFYGAVACGWRSVGYELMPCLVAQAQAVSEAAGVQGVEFVLADMLSSQLQEVGVLLLANQCWDKRLMRAAAHKLSAELPVGAVVVEYTGAMKSSPAFRLLCQVTAPVSWNKEGHIFHLWLKTPDFSS